MTCQQPLTQRLQPSDARDVFVSFIQLQFIRCSLSRDCHAVTKVRWLDVIAYCHIAKCDLSGVPWLQANLRASDGGLGIRTVSKLALSAYSASATDPLRIQDRNLFPCGSMSDSLVVNSMSVLYALHPAVNTPQLSFKPWLMDWPAILRWKQVVVDNAADNFSRDTGSWMSRRHIAVIGSMHFMLGCMACFWTTRQSALR